ncbi:MAG: hypothetical protein LBE49_01870, partial [Deltaproteobacteria bacterium]|nr:hypothetical protein [Deltaproteobacteria bacterium]
PAGQDYQKQPYTELSYQEKDYAGPPRPGEAYQERPYSQEPSPEGQYPGEQYAGEQYANDQDPGAAAVSEGRSDIPSGVPRRRQVLGPPTAEGTGSILEPAVVPAPDGSNPSITPSLEPALEPQVELNPSLELKKAPLRYNPPRQVPKPKFTAEASTAVIVNYLEDNDVNLVDAQGGELAEEDDLDIELMDMRAHEPIRLEARPMIPVPKVPL